MLVPFSTETYSLALPSAPPTLALASTPTVVSSSAWPALWQRHIFNRCRPAHQLSVGCADWGLWQPLLHLKPWG